MTVDIRMKFGLATWQRQVIVRVKFLLESSLCQSQDFFGAHCVGVKLRFVRFYE